MSPDPGWFPDPANPHFSRFWTGTEWGEERAWDGTAWRASPAPPPVAPFAAPGPSVRVASPISGPTQTPARRSPARMLMFLGTAVAIGGACLPWEKTDVGFGIRTSRGPLDTGGILIIAACLAALLWLAAQPYSTMSPRRRIGLWLLAVGGALFVLVVFKRIDNDRRILATDGDLLDGSPVHIGSGLFVFSAGIGLIWLGIIGAAMSSPKSARQT